MLLHAAHAATHGYQSALISSDDIDVFVMCLGFHAVIQAKLFQNCGSKVRVKILDTEDNMVIWHKGLSVPYHYACLYRM